MSRPWIDCDVGKCPCGQWRRLYKLLLDDQAKPICADCARRWALEYESVDPIKAEPEHRDAKKSVHWRTRRRLIAAGADVQHFKKAEGQ